MIDLNTNEFVRDQLLSAVIKMDRKSILKDRRIQSLISELEEWPGTPLSSHRSASQLFHKLFFLADIGLQSSDMAKVTESILANMSNDGIFALTTNINPHYGGTGKDTLGWALCDAPETIYSLIRLGLKDDERVKNSVKYLASLIRQNGYPCKVSESLGKFRGPGRKDDPCPYATLIMLRLLGEFKGYKKEKEICIQALLNLWDNSKTLHPYMFFMGTDFRKLKAPLFWYDIVNVADVLSRFPVARKDKRFLSMISEIKRKATEDGLYIPESIYMSWKGWDFGQKKEESLWLTYYIQRIISRL